MMENEKCSYNWEAKCKDLQMKCCEMENRIKYLTDENSKIGLMYEQLLKEKSDLDRKNGFLEGQIEAYQYCMNVRRL
jgi:predicted nuclease with TOPRIM domain